MPVKKSIEKQMLKQYWTCIKKISKKSQNLSWKKLNSYRKKNDSKQFSPGLRQMFKMGSH